MEDCRVELTVRDEKVDMQAEHVSLEDLTAICGILQIMVGRNAMARGADLETVKDKLLDIYLAAMNDLEMQEGWENDEKGEKRAGKDQKTDAGGGVSSAG